MVVFEEDRLRLDTFNIFIIVGDFMKLYKKKFRVKLHKFAKD